MSTGPTRSCRNRYASWTGTRSCPTGPAMASCGTSGRSSATGCDARQLFDQLADLVHDRLRRGVDLVDQRREVFAVLRVDVELLLLGVFHESRVLHGGAEGIL